MDGGSLWFMGFPSLRIVHWPHVRAFIIGQHSTLSETHKRNRDTLF